MGKQRNSVQEPSNRANGISDTLRRLNIKPTVSLQKFEEAVRRINPEAEFPIADLSSDVRASHRFLRAEIKRFHGVKVSKLWFPRTFFTTKDRDRFGYLTSAAVRSSSKLSFTNANINALNLLGDLMGNSGRESGIADSSLPAGFTYFGQFVDHDITFDVSSTLDTTVSASDVDNMRTPALDLDSVYGRGPALDPFLYEFPSVGPSTAIKFKLGRNTNVGPGGPGGDGGFGGMITQTDFDVPRINGTETAVIGDPRNDENLIVSQFHMTMLRFHNAVVDLLVAASFSGDIFVEAKKQVLHHYQWVVVNDFLERICGDEAVKNALNNIVVAIDSPFSMPVEFSVAAYRFGHSLIRDSYWLNFNFTNQPLSDVFSFIRKPNLPVLSNWVVDFNAFFETGVPVPVFNNARKIDSVLSNGLETLPGGSGIMALLASRNLRRGLSFGLPSGQATATALGITPMPGPQIMSGLSANEMSVLSLNGGTLLNKTPLWYYILRESAVLRDGEQLGPLGAKIVADTFVQLLKRDPDSYLNTGSEFTPILPSAISGTFTLADLIILAGVSQP